MDLTVPFAITEGASGPQQNSRETLVNMYAEIVSTGRAQIIRRQRPGLSQIYALTGEKRAIERFGTGMYYLVVGNTFYSFDGVTLTTLGTLNTSTGPCYIIYNDNAELLVSDGQTGYYWNGSTLTTITPPSGMDGFGSLSYLGGFGVVAVPDSDRFYVTPSNDFSMIDALDFATAESAPDPIVRVYEDHNELWLFGTKTVEIWQFVGSGDFPFLALTNAKIERGLGAPLAVASDDNTVFFLGEDWIIYRAEGYRPVVVSSREIEDRIAAVPLSARTACYAFNYTSRGNKFITFTFPGYLTIQLNITTGLWSTAATYDHDDWRVWGSHADTIEYFLTETGIAQLQAGLSTDEGGVMVRKLISAPGYAHGRRMTVDELFLDAEVGRADINTDADVMCRVARDAETFGNERVRSLGAIGKYTRRTIWRNLGQGRRPVVEVSISDPVEFTVMDAVANVTIDD